MHVLPFSKIRMKDVPLVGGKTASLGEMISIGLPVPNGFAITSKAYWHFIHMNNIEDKMKKILNNTNIKDVDSLETAGRKIRSLIIKSIMPLDLEHEIFSAFSRLKAGHVAVRSSATAEDMPDASFAGQQESYLNVTKKDLMDKVKRCFASLFTDRAISYRVDKGFKHFKVALSVAVQKQIFSESSGVMFTLEPDSGHKNFIYINGSWGLGDYIVQGKVNPDEFLVLKQTKSLIEKNIAKKKIMEVRSKSGVKRKIVPKNKQEKSVLTEKEIMRLTNYALHIENHYKKSMDIEWAKASGKIYIIQARPETVHSQRKNIIEEYVLKQKSTVIAEGNSIGRKIGSGNVNVILDTKDIKKFRRGQVLVTDMTDPDWEPIMKIASAIITEQGGRTSHAAIISREMGVPAILGINNARRIFNNGNPVTVDCTEGNGKVWKGKLKFIIKKHNVGVIQKTRTNVLMNIGDPDTALSVSQLPVDGVGLAREEFIVTSSIGIHPLEMIRQKNEKEYIEKLSTGISKIAAAFYPRPVVIRMSDFKTNEYKNLKGGDKYEIEENNPMIGWRGASRYVDKEYEKAFRMECKAFKKAIDSGLKNIKIMIPFCRTLKEGKKTLEILKSERVHAQIGVMAEIPSNIILADKFSKIFKFFSVGSNDLTQLTLGIDRDSKKLAKSFDENDESVKRSIKRLIKIAHKYGREVGICGQAPSDHPEFAKFLVKAGIDSISVNPDVALQTKLNVVGYEKHTKIHHKIKKFVKEPYYKG